MLWWLNQKRKLSRKMLRNVFPDALALADFTYVERTKSPFSLSKLTEKAITAVPF